MFVSWAPGWAFAAGAGPSMLALIMSLRLSVVAGGDAWTIVDNAYHSYFNVQGDGSTAFKTGVGVMLNGRKFTVSMSFKGDEDGTTYVQVNREHGAKVGDVVTIIDDDGDDEDEKTDASQSHASSAGGAAPALAQAGSFEDIAFSSAVSVEDVKAEVRAAGKPGIVLVTQPWCGACKHLKQSLASSGKAQTIMKRQFVAVHAVADQGEQWQAPGKKDGYIPRIYFLDPSGDVMDVAGPNPKFSHYFSDADALTQAMERVLKDVGKSSEL